MTKTESPGRCDICGLNKPKTEMIWMGNTFKTVCQDCRSYE